MEGMGIVESVPVLGFGVIALEHWVWLPSFAVKVGMVRCESACLCIAFLCLQPFLGRAEGGVQLPVWSLEELMRCGLPVSLLS